MNKKTKSLKDGKVQKFAALSSKSTTQREYYLESSSGNKDSKNEHGGSEDDDYSRNFGNGYCAVSNIGFRCPPTLLEEIMGVHHDNTNTSIEEQQQGKSSSPLISDVSANEIKEDCSSNELTQKIEMTAIEPILDKSNARDKQIKKEPQTKIAKQRINKPRASKDRGFINASFLRVLAVCLSKIK